MKSAKNKRKDTGKDRDLTVAEMKKATGFRNWPPTARDLAVAEKRSAAHLARLDAEIAADPKRVERVRQVRAEAEVAIQLHGLRRRSGKTQAELAVALGTTQSAVARIEHGKNLRLDTIYKYAAACGRSVRIKLVSDPVPAAEPAITYAEGLAPALAMQEPQAVYVSGKRNANNSKTVQLRLKKRSHEPFR